MGLQVLLGLCEALLKDQQGNEGKLQGRRDTIAAVVHRHEAVMSIAERNVSWGRLMVGRK